MNKNKFISSIENDAKQHFILYKCLFHMYLRVARKRIQEEMDEGVFFSFFYDVCFGFNP